MIKKVILIGVIISLILSVPAYGFAATDSQPAIMLDGTKIQASAYIDGRNVYLPLRVVGEALGYKIQWSGKNNPISVSRPGKNIMIDWNNNKVTADDHVYYMSEDYTIIADSTYMEADFFSKNFGLRVRWDSQDGMVQLESVKENAISITTVKEASETDIIKITLQYPQIDGLTDKTVQDSINSIFRESAMDSRNEGLKNADEMEKVIALGYTGSPNKCETYLDYQLKYNQNGLLSVVFMNYQYTGGAHGLTVQSSRTLDLKTGAEYKLKDLVKVDADYVSLISDTVRNAIDERVKGGILPDYSIALFEAIKDDQVFYLSNNAVVVYFQQYEYWPYAAGIQEFPVEYSVLNDMLKSEFSFLNDSNKGKDPEKETIEAKYIRGINQNDYTLILECMDPDRNYYYGTERAKAALQDNKTYFGQTEIVKSDFIGTSPFSNEDYIRHMYRISNRDGVSKNIEITSHEGKVFVVGLFVNYSYFVHNRVIDYIMGLKGKDPVKLARTLSVDDLIYPENESLKVITNYEESFDLETIDYRFKGVNEEDSFFVYEVYGTKNGEKVSHQFKVVCGDGLCGIRDDWAPNANNSNEVR